MRRGCYARNTCLRMVEQGTALEAPAPVPSLQGKGRQAPVFLRSPAAQGRSRQEQFWGCSSTSAPSFWQPGGVCPVPLVPQEPPLTLELSPRPSSTFTPLLVAAYCVVPSSAMAGKRPHQADVTPKVAKRAKAASASGLQRQAPAEPCRGGDPICWVPQREDPARAVLLRRQGHPAPGLRRYHA